MDVNLFKQTGTVFAHLASGALFCVTDVANHEDGFEVCAIRLRGAEEPEGPMPNSIVLHSKDCEDQYKLISGQDLSLFAEWLQLGTDKERVGVVCPLHKQQPEQP